MPGDACVAIVGVASVTARVSVASPHVPLTEALLTSPLYVATHRYVPGLVGVNNSDCATPPVNGTVDVKTGRPAHVALSGPYGRNVTVCAPTGLTTPATVA